MKNEISSLELYYLAKELKVLEGSKVDRVFHAKSTPKELVLGFHTTGQGKSFLRVILPSMIFLSDFKELSDTPTGLCMMLRKYLEGSRLKQIVQKDFERVIELKLEAKIEGKTSNFRLIIELFGKGNVIFCDDDYKILNLLEQQHWKDREVKKDAVYVFPRSQFNVLSITKEAFTGGIKDSVKDSIVKTLAIVFSLGGTYSEEICANSEVEKNKKIKDVTKSDMDRLYQEFTKLFDRPIKANSLEGQIFPFELKTHEGTQRVYYSTFCEAIDKNYNEVRDKESKITKDHGLDKIRAIIEEQTKLLEESNNSYEENQKKGELLYERYQEIKQILDAIKSARKKYSWKDIKKKLDDNPDIKRLVKDIDEKTSSIIIEIEK